MGTYPKEICEPVSISENEAYLGHLDSHSICMCVFFIMENNIIGMLCAVAGKLHEMVLEKILRQIPSQIQNGSSIYW